MPCYIRMKRTFLQGLLWLYLFGFGFMALSLEPGFLDFDNLPDTNFTCVGKVIGGYYADLETNCQMFHVCTIGQLDEPMDIRFLCLNGTVFDQETRVCERIDEVDCTKSEQFYSLNLELYGNSQPSNLEENSETEPPLIIKSTQPTTTTTTTTTTTEPTHAPYYTTATSPTTRSSTQQLLSAHHFPVINSNSPDIRFNPEEINISLHPGAPPDIRTRSHPYYSDKKVTNGETQAVVTTYRSVYEEGANTQKAQSVNNFNRATPGDINFGFTYRNGDLEEQYHTEDPERDSYHYQTEFRPSHEYSAPLHNSQPQQYTSSTYRNDFSATTSKNNNYPARSSTTIRNFFIHSLKPPSADQQSQYSNHQSEKPLQRFQLPLPVLPTLPPLTFSSPAPFSLQQRIETKRYTKDHFPPPRIVISASASVSDASGRRLNYSLGTIGSAPLLKRPPSSYDEYKEEDVALDPFYHDVRKVKHTRKKRSLDNQRVRRRRKDETRLKHSDIIKNEDDAIQVLKFLFDWYKNEKTNPAKVTTPISAPLSHEGISAINEQLSPNVELVSTEASHEHDNIDFKFKTSDVFNKESKYSIIGDDGVSVNHEVKKINNVREEFTLEQTNGPGIEDELFQHEEDYVNDNYEPSTYQHQYEHVKEHAEDYEREFNKDVNGEGIDDHVSRMFDDSKNVSIPQDYVDDNVEPIYYNARNEISKIEEKTTKRREDGSTTEEATSLSDQIHSTEYSNSVEETTEHPEEAASTLRTNDVSSEFAADFVTSSVDESQIISQPTTVALVEFETTLTTETPSITTGRSRSHRRRGRRKFHSTTEAKEKEELKKVLKEKLIEKPYRAKDDYDYLKTVHSHITEAALKESAFTENNKARKDEATANIGEQKESEVRLTKTEDIFLTIVPTTEIPGGSKGRRGKQRSHLDGNRKKSNRRRKPIKPEVSEDYNSDPNNTNSESVEDDSNTTSDAIKGMEFFPKKQEHTTHQKSNDFGEDSEPFSELTETTTDYLRGGKRSRGRSKFFSQLEDGDQPDISRATVVGTTPSPSEMSEIIATTRSPSTESLIHSFEKMSLIRETSSVSYEDKTHAFSERIEDIYATSFVPTTESVHITKKKQLKDNLLNSELSPTTEFSSETDINQDDKEGFKGNTFPTTKYQAGDGGDVTTLGSATDIPTQVTTEAANKFEITTPFHTDHTQKDSLPSMTRGMNLVSIIIEEKVEDNFLEETTTDNYVTTSVVPNELLETTEGHVVTDDTNQERDSIPGSFIEILTESFLESGGVFDDAVALSQTKPVQDTTEAVASTTELVPEDIGTTTEVTGTTTEVMGTTSVGDEYSQIQTTLEQTTVPPATQAVTTNESTTTRSRSRIRGSMRRRPSHQRSYYRHRFSSELSTRRPETRKQTIEEEIVDVLSRRSKQLTTERTIEGVNKDARDDILTEYPLIKSVHPTQAERTLVTTPFSRKTSVRKHFFFNCFGRELNKFYPDPRDCRLFHYCTQGYSDNQLLDMKFVCDLNTYFDDENLICTKIKPKRCL